MIPLPSIDPTPVHAAYIGGGWMLPAERGRTVVTDPATGTVIAEVTDCRPGDASAAVDHAHAAFEAWSRLLPRERGDFLRRWAALIRRDREVLASVLTSEQGKPAAEALAEIDYAVSFVDWFAAEGERVCGETLPTHKPGAQILTRQQPIGVVLAITPWNFPSAMVTRKAAAALAAGCPVIVKPAPETPLSALALARLAEEAGFPAGVFQVVTGDAAALTAQLLQEPRVRAVSFTGSTRVGRIVLEQAAPGIKRVSAELGGNAPFIVFDDCDLGTVVDAAIAAKFATSGQDCLAANRIFVARPLYASFVEQMAKRVAALRIGPGNDPATDIGPMTRIGVAENCRRQIAEALARGAELVVGGAEVPSLGAQYVTPSLLANVTDDMLVAREETFGPVAAILPFDTEAEVIGRANDTEMGLAAYVYTNDLRRALRLTDALG